MSRPPVRWADTQLPESLSRILESAQPGRHDDAAALARMRARLSDSLGPSFETRVPELAGRAGWKPWRAKWLAGTALVAVGLSLLGVRALRGAEREAPAVPAADGGEGLALLPLNDAADGGGAEPMQVQAAVSAPAAEPLAKRRATRPARSRSQEPAKPGLAEELRGIEQIRQLLATSPTRALAAATEQQRRFADGALTPERELLRVEALVRAGRVEEAKARAASNAQYREQFESLLNPRKP